MRRQLALLFCLTLQTICIFAPALATLVSAPIRIANYARIRTLSVSVSTPVDSNLSIPRTIQPTHKISSSFLSTISILKLSNKLSLNNTPPSPDPLIALLEIVFPLLPNHLYPSIPVLWLFLKNVSHRHIMSRFIAWITHFPSLKWSLRRGELVILIHSFNFKKAQNVLICRNL